MTQASSEEKANEAVVRRFYDELWNRWQLGVVDEVLSEALHFRGSLGAACEGREEFKRYVETVRAAFFRLSGGLIEEGWVVGDTQELWRALGALPPSVR